MLRGTERWSWCFQTVGQSLRGSLPPSVNRRWHRMKIAGTAAGRLNAPQAARGRKGGALAGFVDVHGGRHSRHAGRHRPAHRPDCRIARRRPHGHLGAIDLRQLPQPLDMLWAAGLRQMRNPAFGKAIRPRQLSACDHHGKISRRRLRLRRAPPGCALQSWRGRAPRPPWR